MLEPASLSFALVAGLLASEPALAAYEPVSSEAAVPVSVPGASGVRTGDQTGEQTHLPPHAARFSDGGRPRALVVTGAARDDGLRPVDVHELDTGRVFRAFVGDTALVKVRDADRAEAVLASLGVLENARPVMARIGVFQVRDPAGDGVALAQRLAAAGAALLAEAMPDLAIPVRLHEMQVPPDDPRYPGQWYLKKIDIEDAWAHSTGAPDITVLVADNGCDLDHPDLVDKLDPGIDVVDKDGSPDHQPGVPGNEHGTACAGIIGASTNNGTGIAGVCPGCRLRCARLLSLTDEPVSLADLAEVFAFALEEDVDVVSNSWGFVEAIAVPQILADAVTAFYTEGRGGKGGIVVFAAGNDGRELRDDELTGLPGVIGVGAITNFDDLTSFTNYGASLDIVAPTGSLTTDVAGPDGQDPGDYTSKFGGTSSACPVVSGVAGLVLSAAPELTADELADLLITTTRAAPFATPDENGHDPHFGHGIVNPGGAVREALGISVHEPLDAGDGGDERPEPSESCACAQASLGPTLALLPLLSLLSFLRVRRRRMR